MNHSNLVVKGQQQQFIYHHFKLIFHSAKYETDFLFLGCKHPATHFKVLTSGKMPWNKQFCLKWFNLSLQTLNCFLCLWQRANGKLYRVINFGTNIFSDNKSQTFFPFLLFIFFNPLWRDKMLPLLILDIFKRWLVKW